MERKVCKRFVTTTEAEIEEKRLKLNAERTIKQNKAAAAILKDYLFQKKMETGKHIAYNYTVACIMCAV
jgi:stalled ribosome alternative rescue factor ArfA